MGEKADETSFAFLKPFCLFVETDDGSVAQRVGRLSGAEEGSDASQQDAHGEGQGGEHLTAGDRNHGEGRRRCKQGRHGV